jgi:Tfp pilus assembly protein PilN
VLPYDPVETEGEAESPPRGSRLASWLIILGLGVLFLPLYLIASTIKDTSAQLQTELNQLQATLSFTPPPDPSEEALTSTLVYVRQENSALESLQGTLVAMHINWPSIMAVIAAHDPSLLRITAITQTATTITIGGQAHDPGVISAYADMLRASNLFGDVAVGSINIEILPTPTLPPTPTPLPNATQEATSEAAPTIEPQSVSNFEITVTVKVKAS